LVAWLTASGALEPAWEQAFQAMPRDAFAPDVIWVGAADEPSRLLPCHRHAEPDRWADQVFANSDVTTQVDDGDAPGPAGGSRATSGLSAPELVANMLGQLDARPGLRCLEIGTGSGWNAALLAARLGERNVVSVEVDPEVAERARANLRGAGVMPLVVTGDGQDGHREGAPYDRVIATCGVRRVPYAWVEQTRPGGVLLFPLTSDWHPGGYLVRMRVDADGVGIGRFGMGVDFMTLRAQRGRPRDRAKLTQRQASVAHSVTELDPCLLGEQRVLFLLMPVLTPGVAASFDEEAQELHLAAWPDGPGEQSSAVVRDEHEEDGFPVVQSGPRRLWDETVEAWRWWNEAGRPGPEQFGLTVASPTEQHLWLDSPDGRCWPLA
jgi:protein-L-isoaspartate O-methyltransferase